MSIIRNVLRICISLDATLLKLDVRVRKTGVDDFLGSTDFDVAGRGQLIYSHHDHFWKRPASLCSYFLPPEYNGNCQRTISENNSVVCLYDDNYLHTEYGLFISTYTEEPHRRNIDLSYSATILHMDTFISVQNIIFSMKLTILPLSVLIKIEDKQ